MKNTYLTIMSIFALVLTLGLVSASITISDVSKLKQQDGSFVVTVESDVSESINLTINSITNNDDTITFTLNESNFVLSGSKKTINVTYKGTDSFNFALDKTYSTTLTATGSVSNSTTKTIEFESKDYCNGVTNVGKLKVEIEDIQVKTGLGEDNDWYLMDEIEVEVTITNDGNYDLSEISVDWALYNEDGKKIMDDEAEEFDLDSDDEKTITFTFTLDENIEDFDGKNAVLYIKANGEVDDSDSSYDGNATCSSDKESADVISGDDFVTLANFEMNNIEVTEELMEGSLQCGSELTITGEAWNIGEDKQKEVSVEIYSKELNVYNKIELDDIDSYDSEDFSITFTIPAGLEEKTYKIQFDVYDKSGDLFESKSGQEKDSTFSKYIRVSGNCKVIKPTVSAKLDSESKAGNEMIIKTIIVNNEDKSSTYGVTAEGFEQFASLTNVNPSAVVLAKGESKEVVFTFKLNKDAEGEKTFNILTSQNGKTVTSQPVAITVEKSGFSLQNIIKDKEKLEVAGIVLLNIVLVVLIIFVARKILKKKH